MRSCRLTWTRSAQSEPLLEGGNRRCLVIRGEDLYGARDRVLALLRLCCVQEPDVLWQFVLSVGHEEPLDLLEAIVEMLKQVPGGMLDRFASARAFGLQASRLVLVRPRRGHPYAAEWTEAVELYLAAHFM